MRRAVRHSADAGLHGKCVMHKNVAHKNATQKCNTKNVTQECDKKTCYKNVIQHAECGASKKLKTLCNYMLEHQCADCIKDMSDSLLLHCHMTLFACKPESRTCIDHNLTTVQHLPCCSSLL